MYDKDTIISPITSISVGSVCLLRISGHDALNITNQFFPSIRIEDKEEKTFLVTKLLTESNEIIDEVIVYVFKAPHSYTGENVIEIGCHSNLFIVEDILQLFLKKGCRIAKPGEFTQRAFLNGKMDLTQAEAVADLISSKSKTGVKNSLHNIEGRLSSRILKFKESIIDITSLIELGLDFSEEDIETVSQDQFTSSLKTLHSDIKSLLKSFSNSRQFQKGIEVLITGKTNVGKSSIMNALLEKDRVIVSHIPGTTRDHIHEDIIIDNTLVRLIDSAGIRFTDDQVEAAGVERAKKIIKTADIVLAVFDLSENIENEDIEIVNHLTIEESKKLILVGNKSDKKGNPKTINYLESVSTNKVYVSAINDENIDKLKDEISLYIKKEESLDKEDILLTNKRHFDILDRVKIQIEKTIKSFLKEPGHEFIAMDLREILNTFSEITGEITSEDILNNIFSNFCIGK